MSQRVCLRCQFVCVVLTLGMLYSLRLTGRWPEDFVRRTIRFSVSATTNASRYHLADEDAGGKGKESPFWSQAWASEGVREELELREASDVMVKGRARNGDYGTGIRGEAVVAGPALARGEASREGKSLTRQRGAVGSSGVADWGWAWESGAEKALQGPTEDTNLTCNSEMHHYIMHKINGSSLKRTMGELTKVFEVSPTNLMVYWGEDDLARIFDRLEVSWAALAARTVADLPGLVIRSALQKPDLRAFAEHAAAGRHEEAAFQLSPYSTEAARVSGGLLLPWHDHQAQGLGEPSMSADLLRSPSDPAPDLRPFGSRAPVRDPRPGMMVLYNANFWSKSVFVNDCRLVYASGCWSLGGDRNRYSPEKRCDAKDIKYDKVFFVKFHRSRYFFHFVLEGLVRLAPFADLLSADKGILISGVKIFEKKPEILQIFGISPKRLLSSKMGDGCARVLIVPEHVPCEGPTLPMLHIWRAFIARALNGTPNLNAELRVQTFDGSDRHGGFVGHGDWVGNGRGQKIYVGGRIGAIAEKKRGAEQPGVRFSSGGGGRGVILLIRRDQGRRAVENHEDLRREIFATFAQAYTLVVHTGSESMQEQWKMFQEAHVAIGPHGAAWSNLVAMRPGKGVLEFLVPGKEINLCFLACALKLGMQYRAVLPEGATQHGTMRVDVGYVVQEIRKLLNLLDQPILITTGNRSDPLSSHKAV